MNQVLLTKTGKPRQCSRLRSIWYDMRKRCFNKKCINYKHYGAKNITICKEWNDFKTFESWALNNGYADNLSIDRIDYNGNYEPSNCRWATTYQQLRNTRRNHNITINGVTKCLSDWCKEYNMNRRQVSIRIKRFGWEPLRALTTPFRPRCIDLTGQRFGKLLVLKRLSNNKRNGCVFLCQCDCGNVVPVSSDCLRQNHSRSCGCTRPGGRKSKYINIHETDCYK